MLEALDLLATVVFAATGALAASRKGMDLLGFLWLGAAAGVGGGTLRDLILDQPVFWTVNTTPLIASLVAAAAMHFIAPRFPSRLQVLIWLDAFGMAFASTAGTLKCLGVEGSGLVAVVMGVFTASAGGIIRDLLAQEPSIILRRDIYVTAAALGSIVVVVAMHLGLSELHSGGLGFLSASALRCVAIRLGLQLPVYRGRPPSGGES
jgi:uncharacterized membrane protein YeiH